MAAITEKGRGMKQTILFRCDRCGEETNVPLDKITKIPLCPKHKLPMTPVGNTEEVQEAVNEVVRALTRLAAAALRNSGTGPLPRE